jgi:hypothetical protein
MHHHTLLGIVSSNFFLPFSFTHPSEIAITFTYLAT